MPKPARWTVGIDVGGTFTDGIALARDGTMRAAKVPSTPADSSIGFVEALKGLADEGVRLSEIELLFHGTTVATNAVLTGRTARVALIATQGFRDLMSYRTGSRPRLYDLEQPRPSELVARRDRLEVKERLSSLGEVVVPLSQKEVTRIVREVEGLEPDAVAIALLFSYLDDAHEQTVAHALNERYPELPVAISSEVAREFREYPRTATTILNAGLRPIVGKYLKGAERTARSLGVRAPFLVMQSNGGCVPASRADKEAHRLLLSGPTAGVAGAIALGARHQLPGLISLDMGGTSLDVCLVQGQIPPVTPVQEVEGHPILVPSVDIVTAGAGGGSIAHVDRAGRLRVGPQSAGADPGPAAYGRGGTDATLTDAHLVAGIFSESAPLAGGLVLDCARASRAVAQVGNALGLDAPDTAAGIIAVTTAHVVRALRRVSIERGLDPRDFTLVAFGGAGPLLAGRILDEMHLASVLIPARPGLFSAAGLMVTRLRIDDSRTVLGVHDRELVEDLAVWYAEAKNRLVDTLLSDGIASPGIQVLGSADCRYLGQGYELSIPLDSLDQPGLLDLPTRFHQVHETTYGHADSTEPVEIVTVRLSAFGDLSQPGPPIIPEGALDPPAESQIDARRVAMEGLGEGAPIPVYRRELLRARNLVEGPAIIDQMDATTVVMAGQNARIDAHGDLWVRAGGPK